MSLYQEKQAPNTHRMMSLRNSNRMEVEESEFKTCDADIDTIHKFVVDKKKKRKRRNKKKRHTTSLASLHTLPREILQKVFGYCDRPSLEALKLTLPRFSTVIEEEGLLWETRPKLNLDQVHFAIILRYSEMPKSELFGVPISD